MSDLMIQSFDSQVQLALGDITQLQVQAIVNAANESLLGGGGVDGAIHQAAGPELLEACRSLGGCPTGQAKITPGFQLPADYVIHTVGPVYSGKLEDAKLLADAYWNSLEVARQEDIDTLAFPAISTGVYGYPAPAAARIAVDTILQWIKAHPYHPVAVTLCSFDEETDRIYRDVLADLSSEG